MTEKQAEQEFKDWLGWNDKPAPDKDDPDYYEYNWGLIVWTNCLRAHKLIEKVI
jgi:hypothetical protein